MVNLVETDAAAPRQQDSKIYKRLMRNALSNYVGALVSILAGFLTTPFLLHHLGLAMLGWWLLITSITEYGRLFDFGIFGALTKYVAQYRATGEFERGRRIIAASQALYVMLGLALISLTLIGAPLFPRLFHVPGAERGAAMTTVVLMGVWVGLSIACAAPSAVLQGLHRFGALNIVQILQVVVSTVGMVAVVLLGGGIVGLAIVNIVATVVAQALMWQIVNRAVPELRLGWPAFDRAAMRQILGYSSSIFVGQTALRLQTKTDLIVIGAISTASSVTPYAIAWRLSEITRRIVTQFSRALLPMASELHAAGDTERLRALYIVSVRMTLVLAVAVGGSFVALARPFLTVWVGAQIAQYWYLVVVLVVAAIISLSQWPAAAILQGMAGYRPLAIFAVLSGLANLVLSIVLGMQFGLIGVALGTLIPTTIECFGCILPYMMRVLGIPVRDILQQIAAPALLPALPAAGCFYLLVSALRPTTLIEIFAIAATGVLVYVAGYLSVGASKDERSAYRSFAVTTIRFAEARIRRV
jgi:O-antigen/teichoic acid export membrane protein